MNKINSITNKKFNLYQLLILLIVNNINYNNNDNKLTANQIQEDGKPL